MIIRILRELNGRRSRRSIRAPGRWPKALTIKKLDHVEFHYSITKWRGMTVSWDTPHNRLIRHPKDLTRAHRRGHTTIPHSAILNHLGALPRNAPCPYIIRVPYSLDLESYTNKSHFITCLDQHSIRLKEYLPTSCSAWHLIWFSWDCPQQTPSHIFAFGHRDLAWDLTRTLNAKVTL